MAPPGIAPSTYDDRRARQATPSRRQLDAAQLLEMIVKVRTSHEFAGTYGSPRVCLTLRRQAGRSMMKYQRLPHRRTAMVSSVVTRASDGLQLNRSL